jgi:hypothetical protein
MPPSDLDERLRHALSLAQEPAATDEVRGSVVGALPRYRARRRAIAGVTGGSVLCALGLAIGLLVVGVGRSSQTTSATGAISVRAPHASSTPTCMEVQVGSGAPSCVGQVTSGPASVSDSGGSGAAIAGPESTQEPLKPTSTIHIAAGEPVVVFLARIPGVSWNRVTWITAAANGSSPPLERSAQIRLDRVGGPTKAVLEDPPTTSFVLEATGRASCATEKSCEPTAEQWSITVDVR